MITLPLYIFLFLYILALAVFAIFMLIMLYHIISTASFTIGSFFMTFFAFSATALILYVTITLLNGAGIDWKNGITLFNPAWLSTIFTSSSSF